MEQVPTPIHTFVAQGEGPRVLLNLTLKQIAYLLATNVLAAETIFADGSARSSRDFAKALRMTRLSLINLGDEEAATMSETLLEATKSIAPADPLRNLIKKLEADGIKIIKLEP